MRTKRCGLAFALFALFSACRNENGNAGHAHGGTGGEGGAPAGGTGGGGAGSSSRAGAPAASGASSGSSGKAGADSSMTAGTAGSCAGRDNAGGTAGVTAFAGAASSTPPVAGNPNDGGAGGEAGALGEAAGPSIGGSAGHAASGAGGMTGASGASGAMGKAGASGASNTSVGLSWPIDCIPNQTCTGIGYPDTDGDGKAHDCGEPAYVGHQGTDIRITAEAQAAGTAVRAAADGVVLFAFDGKYDQCPDADQPDCQAPVADVPGGTSGTDVCTPLGPYCGTGTGSCFWCFAGGNVIVIRHTGVPGVFATRYDHLKKNSVLVAPGDSVTRGMKIAEAASAGNSTGPHLHFEVWGTGFYELADPWAGPCGPNTGPSLWAHDPPWTD